MELDALREKYLPIVFKLASKFIPGRKRRRRLRQSWWYNYIVRPHIATGKLKYGLNTEPRSHELIVSLTSYPARINELYACVFSLLEQSVKADRVILYLAKPQFPGLEKDLPEALGGDVLAQAAVAHRLVLAVDAAQGAAGEEHRPGAEAPGDGRFLAVVHGGAGDARRVAHAAKAALPGGAIHAAPPRAEGTVGIVHE